MVERHIVNAAWRWRQIDIPTGATSGRMEWYSARRIFAIDDRPDQPRSGRQGRGVRSRTNPGVNCLAVRRKAYQPCGQGSTSCNCRHGRSRWFLRTHEKAPAITGEGFFEPYLTAFTHWRRRCRRRGWGWCRAHRICRDHRAIGAGHSCGRGRGRGHIFRGRRRGRRGNDRRTIGAPCQQERSAQQRKSNLHIHSPCTHTVTPGGLDD